MTDTSSDNSAFGITHGMMEGAGGSWWELVGLVGAGGAGGALPVCSNTPAKCRYRCVL